MFNIMILAQDRLFASAMIDVLSKYHNKNGLKVKSIVSEKSYFKKLKSNLDSDVDWIDSSFHRNENKIVKSILDNEIDILFSLQYKWIISRDIINAVNGYAFNTHFGKLPFYRGHYSHIHAMLNNEKSITTTLHFMDPKVDYGDIVLEKVTNIEKDDTSWSLWHKAVDDAVELNKTAIKLLIEGKVIPRKEVTGDGTFYKINSLEGKKEIISLEDFDEVDIKSRAFYYPPHEPAYFLLNNKKFYVLPKPVYHKTVV